MINAQFTLDPELKKAHKEEIEKIPGFDFGTHTINFHYEITEDDESFYKENKNLLRQAVVLEFMDFIFPKYFGILVVLLIIYQSIIKM